MGATGSARTNLRRPLLSLPLAVALSLHPIASTGAFGPHDRMAPGGGEPLAPEGVSTYEGPPIVVRVLRVEDLDGDLDSYADTGETANLFFSVSNKTTTGYTAVVATMFPLDPKITCVTPSIAVGMLPAGADVTVAVPIQFKVHAFAERGGAVVTCTAGTCSNLVVRDGVHGATVPCAAAADCTRTPDQTYAGRIGISLTSAELAPLGPVLDVSIELDLNVAQPVAATSEFAEGFEPGFGSFTFMNLDSARATNALSDGYRCQHTDPDYVGSNSFGDTECYLGFASGQNPINDWHLHGTTSVDGGRAFQGSTSLHYGRHTPGDPGLDTTSLSQLDAMRTKSPINLAARICAADPAPTPRACNAAADCVAVGGGPCVAASPVLSLKHQVSTMDSRFDYMGEGQFAADRAVIQARALPGGEWQNLPAYENVPDMEGTNYYSNCMFDPVDDGNTEDTWFADTLPHRPSGPSSTCRSSRVFSCLGDTDEPFMAGNIGRASDGPGLAGSVGTGTWVESRFDLSRFRGRSIQVRFIFTSIKVFDVSTLEATFMLNPDAVDDGWYVDDVRLTGALGTASPTATVDEGAPPPQVDADLDGVDDACDNCPGLANRTQDDRDRDGAGDLCDADLDGDGLETPADCDPDDGRFWTLPGAARDLRVEAILPGSGALFTWQAPVDLGGTEVWYDLLRSADPALFDTCPVDASGVDDYDLVDTITSEYGEPLQGQVLSFIVRAQNSCGDNVGTRSDGTPRTAVECP